MTMVLGVRINTFAVTPRWKNPVPDISENTYHYPRINKGHD